jgi:hypothetical protein
MQGAITTAHYLFTSLNFLITSETDGFSNTPCPCYQV